MTGGNLKKKLISGGAWAFGGKLSVTLTALAINMLLARLLSLKQMGAYFLLFSMVSVAALVAQFGLPQTIVRLVAESVGMGDHGRARSAIRAGFWHATIWAGVIASFVGVGGAGTLLARLTGVDQITVVLPMAACWIVVLAWQGILAAVFQGVQDLRNAVIFGGTLSSIIYLILLFGTWLVLRHATLKAVVLCSVCSVAIGVVAGGILVRSRIGELSGEGSLRPRELVTASFPIFVVILANAVLNQSDLWVIGSFRGGDDVALYGAAAKLAGTVPYFLLIVNPVISPFVAELSVQGRQKDLEKLLRNAAALAFIPSLLALAFFLGLGDRVLAVFYGDHYRAGSGVLAILALGAGFNVWAGACGLALMMTGHQATLMKITVVSSLLTVSASVGLVGSFGATGVAWATSCGLIFQNVVMLLTAKRKLGIWTHARCALPDLKGLFAGRRI